MTWTSGSVKKFIGKIPIHKYVHSNEAYKRVLNTTSTYFI